jgi:hypothetical protein
MTTLLLLDRVLLAGGTKRNETLRGCLRRGGNMYA